ncbi:flagellar transcriptional regulator FlhC [Paraburkholderia largidicola]|jgi:flagellar transcriptional activator FlhC|uniref:Flagellar transcriptional regulator FlhC n=1 Tax=Paraburkholderia largidicola TaxID=3014751 RepID=A0A7I8BK09_9BURK|nr:flagellar transcriptional regulator FlhC [Paraburkholderia sp. PGU16]BCF88962.1 flagellar transcriptional regulator FlhC [Paraburkholderia sp. PGU16]
MTALAALKAVVARADPGQRRLLDDVSETLLAIELFELGARLQVTQAETTLSRDRLIRLYKELHRESPPKGMLPFSADWYVTWLPNIHASLFHALYRSISAQRDIRRITAIIAAYRLYLEHVPRGTEPVLSFTRAWTLVRFVEHDMLHLGTCSCCKGNFLVLAYELEPGYVCGLCKPPSRAGKTGRPAKAEQ